MSVVNRYLLVTTAPYPVGADTAPAGAAIQRILWDGVSPYTPAAGLQIVPDDGRDLWTPPAPTLSLADQARALLAGGLTITSPTIPLAVVTFPTDTAAIDKYNSVQTYIMTHGGMIPGGGSSGLILDAANGWHTVTTAQYTQIVSAIAVFVAECHLAMDGYPNATLPPTSVTIA